jgi:hypothetical protein
MFSWTRTIFVELGILLIISVLDDVDSVRKRILVGEFKIEKEFTRSLAECSGNDGLSEPNEAFNNLLNIQIYLALYTYVCVCVC